MLAVYLAEKKTQCSLFIFVGQESYWLSNKGKSHCPWEIIIKQRRTHSAQCSECVNAGGEQVCCTDSSFEWCQHNRRNKGFHRARGWRIALWLGLMLHCGNSAVTIVLAHPSNILSFTMLCKGMTFLTEIIHVCGLRCWNQGCVLLILLNAKDGHSMPASGQMAQSVKKTEGCMLKVLQPLFKYHAKHFWFVNVEHQLHSPNCPFNFKLHYSIVKRS